MKVLLNRWFATAAALLAFAVASVSQVGAGDDISTPGTASVLSLRNDTSHTSYASSEVDVPADPTGSVVSEGTEENCIDQFAGAPGRFWFEGDYLHWWTRGQHLPPLVSTVTDLNNPTGSLQTVYGNQTVENGDRNGFLGEIGGWFDCAHTWGMQIEYFDLGQANNNYDSGFSDGFVNGASVPLVRPFYDPAAGIGVDAVAYPNQYAGRVTVVTSSYFQSAAATLRHSLYATDWAVGESNVNWIDGAARSVRVDVLGGYRYMRLNDEVTASDSEIDINAASPTYLNTFTNIDSYKTRNDFNGGEIGLDMTTTRGRWSIETIGKVAIGDTRQVANLYGFVGQDASNVGGGVGSNTLASEYSRDRFSMIPQFTINAGFNVTDYLKLTAGYDIMYWSHVARAGDQIAVNGGTGLPYGSLIGTPLPAFAFQDNYFWAQGFRIGAELRY
jgi:hypothetical protein